MKRVFKSELTQSVNARKLKLEGELKDAVVVVHKDSVRLMMLSDVVTSLHPRRVAKNRTKQISFDKWWTQIGDGWKRRRENFEEFNAKAKKYEACVSENQQYESQNGTDTQDVYIGSSETLSLRMMPKIIAQIRDVCIDGFKDYMNNYYEKYNDEIKYDVLDYTHSQHGKINYLLSPNKNLASISIFDQDTVPTLPAQPVPSAPIPATVPAATARNTSAPPLPPPMPSAPPPVSSVFNRYDNFHCWLPTVFKVYGDYGSKVAVCGDIHNLDRHKFSRLHNIFIPRILEQMLPSFVNLTEYRLNQTGVKFKCIIQIKDYEVNEEDLFEGGIHKDGLFEDIKAIGIYYYHLDDNLQGGGLELHAVVEEDDYYERHATNIEVFKIPVKENRMIVFDNKLTYHKVSRLKLVEKKQTKKKKKKKKKNRGKNKTGSPKPSVSNTSSTEKTGTESASKNETKTGQKVGHRKCILFFLLNVENMGRDREALDTNVVQTNLHYHMVPIVSVWFGLHNVNKYEAFGEEYNYNQGYRWLFDTISIYLVGDRHFIETTKELFRKARKVYRYERYRSKANRLIQRGFDFQRQDW